MGGGRPRQLPAGGGVYFAMPDWRGDNLAGHEWLKPHGLNNRGDDRGDNHHRIVTVTTDLIDYLIENIKYYAV